MKKLIFIITIFLMFGCEPKIQNDQETLNKIFDLEKFNIVIGNYGCFGGQTNFFELKKTGNKYLLISEETKKSHLINSVEFDSLKMFFSNRIGTKQGFPLCTGELYIRAGNYFSAVDYSDTSCGEDWNTLNKILKFTEIIDYDALE